MHIERSAVLSYVRRGPCSGNSVQTSVPKDPGERYLSWRHAMPGRHFPKHRVAEQSPLFDGRIGHDWEAACTAPGQQIIFNPASREVVENLVGGDSGTTRKGQQFLQIRDGEIAHAPQADFPRVDECCEAVERFLQRDRPTPVEEVEVELICPEAVQAALTSGDCSAPGRVLWQDLAHQERLVASSGKRLTDEFFRGTIRVHLSSIDHGHPEVETEAQRRDFLLAAPCVFGHAPRPLPEYWDGVTRWKSDRGKDSWSHHEPPHELMRRMEDHFGPAVISAKTSVGRSIFASGTSFTLTSRGPLYTTAFITLFLHTSLHTYHHKGSATSRWSNTQWSPDPSSQEMWSSP